MQYNNNNVQCTYVYHDIISIIKFCGPAKANDLAVPCPFLMREVD